MRDVRFTAPFSVNQVREWTKLWPASLTYQENIGRQPPMCNFADQDKFYVAAEHTATGRRGGR